MAGQEEILNPAMTPAGSLPPAYDVMPGLDAGIHVFSPLDPGAKFPKCSYLLLRIVNTPLIRPEPGWARTTLNEPERT